MDEVTVVVVPWCGFMGNIVAATAIETIVSNVEMDVATPIAHIGSTVVRVR